LKDVKVVENFLPILIKDSEEYFVWENVDFIFNVSMLAWLNKLRFAL